MSDGRLPFRVSLGPTIDADVRDEVAVSAARVFRHPRAPVGS